MAETGGVTPSALAIALERYAALTGDLNASLDDPLVRRFCEAFDEAAAEVESAEIPLRCGQARVES